VAVGGKVTNFKPGDSIYALVAGGAYAEYCTVDAALTTIIPPNWDFLTAAALPEALITAQATVFTLGQLQEGQTLLMHGAGSGITSLAIPMAKYRKAKVITTVGDASRVEKARALGADQIVNYSQESLESAIAADSLDCIVDFVGGDYFNKHLSLLKPQGKLIQIAFLKDKNAHCDLSLLTRKRLQIMGFVLRSQSLAEKAGLWHEAHELWYEALCDLSIKPVIDSVYDLTAIEEAHRRMREGGAFWEDSGEALIGSLLPARGEGARRADEG